MNRIPEEAYQYYIGLGPTRTYQAVATRYGVSRRAVTKKAGREHWQERLAKVEAAARDRFDERLLEDIDSMNSRHLKMLGVIQGKALEALRSHSIHSAAAAGRALDAAIGRERSIRGAPETLRGAAAEESAGSLGELVAAIYEQRALQKAKQLPVIDCPPEEGT